MQLIVERYASSKILRICKHLAVSLNPTISSGEQILMNGKSERSANLAASAVLPAFGGPSNRMDTKPVTKKNQKQFFKIFANNSICFIQQT